MSGGNISNLLHLSFTKQNRKKSVALFFKWVRDRVCDTTCLSLKMLFHKNRLHLNALISKEICFWSKDGRKKIQVFLSEPVISEISWGMAASSQHWRYACFERKELETPKCISQAIVPRTALTSTHFLHKSLMKTNWRGKSSQLTFIKNKSCQNNVMAFLCLGDLLEGEGESVGYQGGYQLAWTNSSDAATRKQVNTVWVTSPGSTSSGWF